jgi:hypothetical protein
MFGYLKFKMQNSIGTAAAVNLFNDEGLIGYEVLFPDLGVGDVKRRVLGRTESDTFLRRLDKSGFVMFIKRFADLEEKEDGDFWTLEMELPDSQIIRLSGPEPESSALYPFIQDFAELLDTQFKITQYISPDRVDKLSIEFYFNELDSDLEQCTHTEEFTIDRSDFTLSYVKRFPVGCFHSSYQCKCEQQVRQILDQTSAALTDDRLFEDCIEINLRRPVLYFKYFFHDGSTAEVRRSLSHRCLREQLYIEMLEVLFETSLHLMYKYGLFDKRFVYTDDDEIKTPFVIDYSEEETA